MANIQKKISKGKEVYVITVFLERSENKSVRKSISYFPKEKAKTKIKKEVEAFALEFEAKVKEEYEKSKSDVLFSNFYKKWYDNYCKQSLVPRTCENIEGTFHNYFLPVLADKFMQEIKAVDIQEVVDNMFKKGLKRDTAKKYFNILNQLFSYAHSLEIISSNPCEKCIIPKNSNSQSSNKNYETRQFYSPDDIKTLLTEVFDKEYTIHYNERIRIGSNGEKIKIEAYDRKYKIEYEWKVFFYISAYTGLRPAEILALSWNDFFPSDARLRINKAYTYSKLTGAYIKAPKTKAGNRDVYIPNTLVNMLLLLKEEQMKKIKKMGSKWKGDKKRLDNNLIFPQSNGLPKNISTPSKKFQAFLDLYNSSVSEEKRIPKLRLYDLRHAYATNLISNGCNIEALAQSMGHKDVAVTLNIYGHALKEDVKAAPNLLKQIYE